MLQDFNLFSELFDQKTEIKKTLSDSFQFNKCVY